jgi:ribose transport system permease protein
MSTVATLPPTPSDDDAADRRVVPQKSAVARWLSTSAAWVLLLNVALAVVFTALSNNQVFLTLTNIQSMLLGGTEALLLALGLAMMLGAGIFDLSLGSNLVLSSVVGASVIQAVAGTTPDASGNYANAGTALLLGLVASVITGVLFGLINGMIIAYLDVNSLIATLGTLGIGMGIALLITNGGDIGGLPPTLQTSFGLRTLALIPLPAFIAVILAILLWAVLRYTRYGLHTLAIGSSRSSAERAGVQVKRHLVTLAVLAGALAGLAGFVDLARFGSTTAAGHNLDGLAAVTAVVIGGTLLEGGRVSIIGAVWGTVLAVVLQNGLVVLDVPTFYQLIAIGLVLVVAVSIDRIRYKRSATR